MRLISLVLFLAAASAQHAFDAVSVKRNQTTAAGSETDTTPGRVRLVNATMLSVIQRAFRMLPPQIVDAPDWTRTERYDILGVTGDATALTDERRQEYFQALLADRCHFRFHRETRDIRVYSLVPAASGPTIAVHEGGGEYSMRVQPTGDGRFRLRSTKGNMGRLAEILTGQLGEIVADRSGLPGEYDFTLEWTPAQNPDAAGPSLFTAVSEQLGLRLESSKRPTPVIVIDAIERPSEN